MSLSAMQIFKVVNLGGMAALVATFVTTESIPAAWRVAGVLCMVDAAFLFRTGTTEVLGATNRPFRGVPAYALATFIALVGVTLVIFATDLYCLAKPENSNVCS